MRVIWFKNIFNLSFKLGLCIFCVRLRGGGGGGGMIGDYGGGDEGRW